MLPHFFLIGTVSVAAAVSDPPDCGWKIMFPYVPCVEAGSIPSHAGNETTSPHNCYQSFHSGSCVYCGYWEGKPALMNAETLHPDSICATGYCDFQEDGDLVCVKG